MSRPLAALSVDLDEVGCYAAIHGLPAPRAEVANVIYDRALPRFHALFGEFGIPATFFVIGADCERPQNAASLAALSAEGHELANHSYSHFYDLSRRDRDTLRSELQRCQEALRAVTGRAPVGFRAPGYTIDDTLFDVLEELGFRYDSSVFPCPAYYLAKATAITAMALRGKRSHSILDDPRVLTAPADPYRVARPYRRRGGAEGLIELPIGVTRTPPLRLPYIGTSVVLSSPSVVRWLTRAMAGRPLINLELHGIDLADAEEDGLQFLRPHQPDLRRPLADKRAALHTAIQTLRDMGAEFVTLEAACERLFPASGATA